MTNEDLFACDIEPRPLSYPLRSYHFAPSEGELFYTWQDKPHRLLYDLIAAVKYYAHPNTPEGLLRQSEREGWRYSKELEAEIKRLQTELERKTT